MHCTKEDNAVSQWDACINRLMALTEHLEVIDVVPGIAMNHSQCVHGFSRNNRDLWIETIDPWEKLEKWEKLEEANEKHRKLVQQLVAHFESEANNTDDFDAEASSFIQEYVW